MSANPEVSGGPGPVLYGRGHQVGLAGRVLLAPMEGITERCFRDLVIAQGGVGGACTEFLRITSSPLSRRVVRRELGVLQSRCPVGVQIMAGEPTHVPDSVAVSEDAGAAFIDLNFGCPAPVVFDKCAGSALLGQPALMARIIASAVSATGLPVTVKIRAGITDASPLTDAVRAAVGSGAAMITIHGRLRTDPYSRPARWEWIAQARSQARELGSGIVVTGNGGVDGPGDVQAMIDRTLCDAVMIGRAALADPWIFRQAAGGPAADASEAAGFALAYAAAITATYGPARACARLKQLIRYYRAGGLFEGREAERARLLRCPTLAGLTGFFEGLEHPAAVAAQGMA